MISFGDNITGASLPTFITTGNTDPSFLHPISNKKIAIFVLKILKDKGRKQHCIYEVP